MMRRRDFLAASAATVLGSALGVAPRAYAKSEPIPEDVLAFHRECLVLDLHIDTLLWTRLQGYDLAQRHENHLPASAFGWHLDLPRAAEGGLDACVFGLVINPAQVRPELMFPLKFLAWWEGQHGIAQTLATIDLLDAAAKKHPDRLVFARTGSELRAATLAGRFGGLVGLEGSQGIEGSLDHLRKAHERGMRMLGLVHFQSTEAAYPMTVSEFDAQGLTPFGRDLIAEMERLGMIVDLAHLNAPGVGDALAAMRRPFVVSHTACRALVDHPRNLSDEQIRAIADRGGVIGLAFGRDFVHGGLEGLLDHFDHLIRVGGAATPALGSDFDGMIVPLPELGDVTCYPLVTRGLLARGHKPDVVRGVLGENAMRVITEICG